MIGTSAYFAPCHPSYQAQCLTLAGTQEMFIEMNKSVPPQLSRIYVSP